MNSITSIFNINSEKEFNTVSLEIFNFQWTNNPIYQQFCNYLKINPDSSTSVVGVWAAGDITNGSDKFRQVITAAAEGAIAARSIFNYLKK